MEKKITIDKNTDFSKLYLTPKEIKELIKNNPEYIKYIEKVFKERKFKSIKDLDFTDGYLFGTVMLNKEICKGVLEAILEFKITDIKFIELEKTTQNGYETKSVHFDVILKDDKENIYNIEMQVSSKGKKHLGKRTRFYQIMIDSLMLKKGDDYSKLKKSIIIFICPFKLFDKKRQLYTFNSYCKEDKNLKLNDETTKIFISTKNKKDKKLNDDLEELINFINGKINNDNALIDKIIKEIKEIKNREEWRVEYMLSVLNNSDARREGEYIGEKRGETKNKVNNIKSFVKKLHLPIEQIMDILDIPIEEQRLYYKLVNDPVFYEKYFADKSNFVDPSDDEDEDFEENDYEE